MKKLFFVVAVATLFFSCQKELEPATTPSGEKFSVKASIENLIANTKADMNDSNELVWAKGDKIGLYVPGWGVNQPFTLVGDGGSTTGTFTWDNQTDENSFADNAAAAFFPWQGTESWQNNVYDGVMYFKLSDAYYSYSSGKMLTPLIAPMANSSSPIEFKHAGAAVQVTINNLPAHVHSMGMSVDGQQITGSYKIDPAQAGSAGLTLDGEANLSKNSIWLNVWNGKESKFTFIFPVPALTSPKLSFSIYDENDILVWTKTPKAQSNLKRGDVLVMPPLTITPYSQFTESDTWTFCGTINGSAWMDDVPLVSDGKICILSGFTFKPGDKFKIRKDGLWNEAYPSEDYLFTTDNAGAWDIFFNIETKEISLVEPKCAYPTVNLPVSTSITIDGDMSDWATVQGATHENHTFKVFSDDTNVYFYSKRSADGNTAMWGGGGYVYFTFDLDNNSETGDGDIYGNKGEFVGLIYPYGGSAAEPEINENPSKQCSPDTYSLANLALKGVYSATDGVELEFSVPRADLPEIPNTAITIESWGNKSLGHVTLNRTL